jgi:hypothetical protein
VPNNRFWHSVDEEEIFASTRNRTAPVSWLIYLSGPNKYRTLSGIFSWRLIIRLFNDVLSYMLVMLPLLLSETYTIKNE